MMRRMRTRQYWLYKNREKGDSSGHEGNWARFFLKGKVRTWSDPDMKRIAWGTKANPRPGDLVFAQQLDDPRSIVGIAEVVDSTGPVDLTLRSVDYFSEPVPVPYNPELARIAPEVASIRAMGKVAGSLFLLSGKEASALARFCKRPSSSLITTPKRRAKEDLLSEAGGGYGTSYENRKIELTAIAATLKHFDSDDWSDVVDVQKNCCGYDLIFCKAGEVLHVEVKGVRGPVPSFFLTANEERCMRTDEAWRLCVVTEAGTAKPNVEVFDSRKVAMRFGLRPSQFRVYPRGAHAR